MNIVRKENYVENIFFVKDKFIFLFVIVHLNELYKDECSL